MAKYELKNPLSIHGPLFVDTTCIDCGTCFHIAPNIFEEVDDASIVKNQPKNAQDWSQAKGAIISCPTNSIGLKDAPAEFKEASDLLPLHITENIYYLGYSARSSFGATSYLIKSHEGNILIDSPRFHPQLVKKLEEMGGVKLMYLSHRDDVADHQKYAEHFKCERIIHAREVETDTRNCEHILEGDGDWDLTPELKILFTPGHTAGHLCLLYKEKYLFTGDHLFYSPDRDQLYASQSVCWYSWEEQLKSVAKLLRYNFEWVLPGHGGWVQSSKIKIHKDISTIESIKARLAPDL
jgi:glyoxylase-like metal-dependent hydrolase (beta-lactamase superfamily II)/ferredoxin